MRYFKLFFGISVKQIEENAKIRLKDYSYDSTIMTVNVYMYENMRNGLSFLIYRTEENESVLAGFAFDEKHEKFNNTYAYIMELLYDTFGIKKVIEEPSEVTMFEYSEQLKEAKRRDFLAMRKVLCKRRISGDLIMTI